MAVILGIIAWLAVIVPTVAQDIATAERVVRDAYGGEMRGYRVTEEQRLRFAELISTLDASALSIRFIDGTRLSVGENASLRLDGFVFDPAQGAGLKGTIRLTEGALRFIGSKARKDVALQTPVAAIGIRGTELNVRVGGGATEIEVLSGEVTVTGAGAPRIVRPGEFLRVAGGGASGGTPPAAFRAAFAQIGQALGPATATAGPTPAAPASAPSAGRPAALAEIRDAGGRVIGYRRVHGSGRVDILDTRRMLIGYYRPDTDITYAASGRQLGAGDRTAALIPRRP